MATPVRASAREEAPREMRPVIKPPKEHMGRRVKKKQPNPNTPTSWVG